MDAPVHVGPEVSALDRLRRAGGHPILRSFPHGALIVFDADLRYLAAGGLGLADVGLSREMLEGHTIAEVYPSEVVEALEPLYQAALRGEHSATDIPFRGRVYLQRLGPLHDEHGTVIGGMGFTQDVTEARHGQQSLEASERRLRVAHRRLEEAQTLARVGSWEWDLGTGLLSWSDAMLALYGLDPAAFDGDYASALACIHPDDRERVDTATEACLTTGSSFSVRYRVNRIDDGELRWFDARGAVLREGDVALRIVGAVADVTEQVRAEHEALRAQAFGDAVLAASPDLTVVTDLASGRIIYGSREGGMLGLSTEALLALTPEDRLALVHPEDRVHLRATEDAAAALPDGEVLQVRYRGHHTDGKWRWRSRRITPFRRDGHGRVDQVLAVTRDVTDVVEAEQRLTHAALHDSLTGLPNRALVIDRINTALVRAMREGREVAVLFVDLDGFKRVNDTFGHAIGDAVLVEAARRISGVLREGDTVARVGGDEFVLVVEPWNRLPGDETSGTADTDRELGTTVAGRVAAALQRAVVVDGVEHVVTASIGMTHTKASGSGPPGSLTAEQMVQDADTAMYNAKSRGRDRVEVFEQSLRTDLAERGRIERLLHDALRPDRDGATLTAVYQPVVDGSGVLRGFEALARLVEPSGAVVPPDVFIPVAEDTGQIRGIGCVVLGLACAQLDAWRRGHPHLDGVTMAVNVSAVEAQHGALEQQVRGALAAHGLHPRDLTLELTETALLQASHSTLSTLHRLRDDGIGIAIDDFGTGYGSLRYLTTLPVSTVKVDRSFTAGLPGDETSRAIVNAVAGLAADLGLTCIVEGVETEDQRAALPRGVHLQGWLIGHPSDADQLSDHLLGRSRS
jgi:diguanylate cyclase (GGDEF)-like protein/PAS domain S-box-containing protein